MKSGSNSLNKLLVSAMLLAVALVLPFLTAQVRELGSILCPMHLPIMICGILCGPWYGIAAGFIAPLLRSMIFGMPMLVPTGIAMAFELACYGLVTGLLYRVLFKIKGRIYIALVLAMLLGRIVSVAVRFALYGLGKADFVWAVIFANTFTKAIPGMALQLILIPILIGAVDSYTKQR